MVHNVPSQGYLSTLKQLLLGGNRIQISCGHFANRDNIIRLLNGVDGSTNPETILSSSLKYKTVTNLCSYPAKSLNISP